MEKNHPLNFGNHFLDQIIFNSITDTEFLSKIRTTLNPNIFKTRERKTLINFIYEFYDEFKEAPKDNLWDIIEANKPFIQENLYERCEKLVNYILEIKNSNKEYVLKSIRKAISHFAMEESVIKAAQLVKDQKYDEARSILLEGFREPNRIEKSYYDFLQNNEFMERRSKGKVFKMKTLIPELDKVIGGFNNWLVTILGATKGGKTKFLLEFTVSAAQQGKNVLFVSLEMNKGEIEDGLDQAIGFLGSEPGKEIEVLERTKDDWVKVRKVVDTIFDLQIVEENRRALRKLGGKIIIHDASSLEFNYRDLIDLMSQIEQEEKINFDVVVVDYLGEMGPTDVQQKEKQIISANTSGLKNVSREKCCVVITAQQGNREAMMAKVFRPNMISDDIKPVFISDLVLAICQTPKEEKLNMYRLYVALFRHGPKGAFLPLMRDTNIGQIALGTPSKRILEESRKTDSEDRKPRKDEDY